MIKIQNKHIFLLNFFFFFFFLWLHQPSDPDHNAVFYANDELTCEGTKSITLPTPTTTRYLRLTPATKSCSNGKCSVFCNFGSLTCALRFEVLGCIDTSSGKYHWYQNYSNFIFVNEKQTTKYVN